MLTGVGEILAAPVGQVGLLVHFPEDIGVLNIIWQGVDQSIVLIALQPHILVLAEAPGLEELPFLLDLVQVLLVLGHLLQMALPLVLIDLIWKLAVLPKLLLFLDLIFVVTGF